jgi:hypothetical protein
MRLGGALRNVRHVPQLTGAVKIGLWNGSWGCMADMVVRSCLIVALSGMMHNTCSVQNLI